MSRRAWLVPAGLVLLLAGAGVFFAVQGLGDADRYASIGSFLLALVVAGATLFGRLRDRGDPQWHGTRHAHHNDIVVQGDGSPVTYVKNVHAPPEPPA